MRDCARRPPPVGGPLSPATIGPPAAGLPHCHLAPDRRSGWCRRPVPVPTRPPNRATGCRMGSWHPCPPARPAAAGWPEVPRRQPARHHHPAAMGTGAPGRSECQRGRGTRCHRGAGFLWVRLPLERGASGKIFRVFHRLPIDPIR